MQTIDNFSGDLTRRLLGNPLPELDRLLLEAAHEGDAAAVVDLLAQGASPSAVDDEGRHALFLAVAAGHLKCVKALLPVSDPDLQDCEKWRPIFFAGREIGDPGDGEAREIIDSARSQPSRFRLFLPRLSLLARSRLRGELTSFPRGADHRAGFR